MTRLFIYLMLLSIINFPTTVNAKEELITAWVITDLHYLSPSLHDNNGSAYQHIRNTGAGKDFDYGKERMEALTEHIDKEQPDILLVSGDLSLNGEYQSMQDLSVYFALIEKKGTQVFVIPGNHDISSGWAREFKGENFLKARQVLPNDFKEIFNSFGYQEAIKLDKNSLSYLAEINEDYWLLMIDSNIYSDIKGKGAPKVNGVLTEGTLSWIEHIYVEAKNKNKKIIPVIHHNTVTHFERLDNNYTLDNAPKLREILFKYHVPFTLSGHIHTQHYATMATNQHQLTDIVTGAFSSYPSYIGKLSFHNNLIDYQAEALPMSDYAIGNELNNPQLTDYKGYMKNLFDESSKKMAFREMIEEGWYQKDNPLLDEVANYVAIVNLAYFSGKPLSTFDLSSIPNLEEIKQLINDKSGVFFKNYIQMIEENQHDYTQIKQLKW